MRLFTEYSAGKKRFLTPASPFQLSSVSNWKEYTQQNRHSCYNPCGCSPWLPFTPVCHHTLKNRRSGRFWRAFGLKLAQMKQRLFGCLRSRNHGADLSRRVASVSGILWVLATDLRWLTPKGKSGASHLLSPLRAHHSRFPDGGRLHREVEKEMFFSVLQEAEWRCSEA